MICVAKNDLGFNIILELSHVNGFDGAYGTHRHEYGGFNNPMPGGYASGSGVTCAVSMLKFKCQSFQNGLFFRLLNGDYLLCIGNLLVKQGYFPNLTYVVDVVEFNTFQIFCGYLLYVTFVL